MTTPAQTVRAEPMRALTVRQPWAWLIAAGLKDIENRDWKLPAAAIGIEIALHASKAVDRGEVADVFADLRRTKRVPRPPRITLADLEAQAGCILGLVTFSGATEHSDSPWFVGRYGWQIASVRQFAKPIPARGALGFWTLGAELEAQVRTAPVLDPDAPDHSACPKCGAWVPDYDGFGVLAHLGPTGCGYCSHPSRDDGKCGICGEVRP